MRQKSTYIYERVNYFVYCESFWKIATLASFIVSMFFLVHSDSPAFASSFSGSVSPSKKCYGSFSATEPNRNIFTSNAYQSQKFGWIRNLLLSRSFAILPRESQFISLCPSPARDARYLYQMLLTVPVFVILLVCWCEACRYYKIWLICGESSEHCSKLLETRSVLSFVFLGS